MTVLLYVDLAERFLTDFLSNVLFPFFSGDMIELLFIDLTEPCLYANVLTILRS
jgi:hypothetical protein